MESRLQKALPGSYVTSLPILEVHSLLSLLNIPPGSSLNFEAPPCYF